MEHKDEIPSMIELTAEQVRTLIMLEHTREQLSAQLQGITLVISNQLLGAGVPSDADHPGHLHPYNLDIASRKLVYTPRLNLPEGVARGN